MSTQVPIQQPPQGPAQQITNLFAEKGELITQIEIAQAKLAQVNQRLSMILNSGQTQPTA